jgi:hypothetical protein
MKRLGLGASRHQQDHHDQPKPQDLSPRSEPLDLNKTNKTNKEIEKKFYREQIVKTFY